MVRRRRSARAGWSPAPPASPATSSSRGAGRAQVGGSCDRRAVLRITRVRQPGASLAVVAAGALAGALHERVAPSSRTGWCGRRARSAPRTTGWCTRRHAAPASGAATHRTRRRRESIATRSRPSGVVYNRRTHTRAAGGSCSAVPVADAGSGPVAGEASAAAVAGGGGSSRPSRSQARATGAGHAAVAGDPGRFEHRPVRVTGAEQGPVGHHQVHLHRLQLTHRPPGQQPQRGVRRDRTHPTTVRPLLRALATDHRPRRGPAPPRAPRPRP